MKLQNINEFIVWVINKIKESRILYIILHILRHISHLYVINIIMIMHEDSNKLYTSMVARYQIILECSVIMH